MAQQDTGLGWNAKDEYLFDTSRSIGELTTLHWNDSYPHQPLPVITDPNIVLQRGLKYFSDSSSHIDRYIASTGADNIFVCSGGNKTIVFLSPTENAEVIQVYYNTQTETIESVGYPKLTTKQTVGGVNFYRIGYDMGTGHNVPSEYPNVSTSTNAGTITTAGATELLANRTTQIIYKLNSGYAVCCFAKWYSPSGDEIFSPVLISSNADYATISLDGSSPASQGRTSAVWQGMNFTMSYIPNLTGTLLATVPVLDLRQFAASTPEKILKIIADESLANIIVSNPPDPYQEPESEEGGGDGEEDDEDDVDFTDPPSTSIGATGFLTIFTPSLGQLQNLAGFMWSSFDVDNWRRLFANPMDAILGLHLVPVPPIVTGTKTVKVAGISTEIEMDYTTTRYIRRSMGTCEVPKKWGAYLDYNPYTKVSLFLPYIGFKDIDADDIMGETIALQYMVDILTGACVAELKCGDTVLYSWQGNCANEVPITGSDWRGAIASALGIAGSIAATALTGGASAPMIAGTIASVGANSLNLKPSVNRSGAIAGSAGFMGAQRPYIIRTVPNLVIPADQNKMIGYPSFVNASLGSLTGYNEISAIHLEGIPATGNELSEIETLLKGGVIF